MYYRRIYKIKCRPVYLVAPRGRKTAIVRTLSNWRAAKGGDKMKCELCGEKTELYAHHTDYSQPLKVIFLCDKCHKIEHKKINEKMRKIENGKICSC